MIGAPAAAAARARGWGLCRRARGRPALSRSAAPPDGGGGGKVGGGGVPLGGGGGPAGGSVAAARSIKGVHASVTTGAGREPAAAHRLNEGSARKRVLRRASAPPRRAHAVCGS